MSALSVWTSLALLSAGFGLKALIDAAMEWHAQRPQRAVTSRNYFRPCTGCTIRNTSEIGRRVQRAVVHVRSFGRAVRGQTWWAGGRRSA